MSMRFRPLVATLSALAGTVALTLPAGAGAAGSLPTLTVALNGPAGVSVSGSPASGAVRVVATFTGKSPGGPNNTPAFGLVRLHNGEFTFLRAPDGVLPEGDGASAQELLLDGLRRLDEETQKPRVLGT